MQYPPRPTLFPYTTLFRSDFQHFSVRGGQRIQRIECTIPGDAPSAAALLAAGIAAEVPLSLRDADPMGEEMQSLIGAFRDRKSTRLNSSHMSISYAVFCLK